MKVISEHLWNDAERRKQKYWEKTLSQYALSTTNRMWTGLASNPVFRINSPTTKDLSHCMAFETPRRKRERERDAKSKGLVRDAYVWREKEEIATPLEGSQTSSAHPCAVAV
jgi:hypothetical protein